VSPAKCEAEGKGWGAAKGRLAFPKSRSGHLAGKRRRFPAEKIIIVKREKGSQLIPQDEGPMNFCKTKATRGKRTQHQRLREFE